MKRLFDIFFSIILIIILFIPIIIIAILVRLSSKGTVIYWSQRVGVDNILFYMPKFRSMKNNTPAIATHLMAKPEQYLTKIGSFLRKSSLDELPQLYSILIGRMSFVGPRPALYNQYDLIKLRKKLGIDKLTPGLTGWSQVNGRDSISIQEKVKLEKEYLKKKSFIFDLKILWLTLLKIISNENVSH
jgi:O-antigen biosynthesis protein WbqP